MQKLVGEVHDLPRGGLYVEVAFSLSGNIISS